jgi:membrane-associated phospholipid phosphatase
MATNKSYYSRIADTILISEHRRDKTARIISTIFSPPLLAVASLIIAAQAVDNEPVLYWTVISIVLFVLIPTIYILSLVRRGHVTDFHMKIREQRAWPLIIILLISSLVFFVMYFGGAPRLMLIISSVAIIQLMLIVLITFRWKISGHCTAASGLAVVAIALFGQSLLPVSLIIPVTAWSRVRLDRHTYSQSLAGIFLGVATATSILYFTNII